MAWRRLSVLALGLAASGLATGALAGDTPLVIPGSDAPGAVLITTDTTLYSGPGDSYPPIVALTHGLTVTLSNCQGSYCYVEYDGKYGWVYSDYIDHGGHGAGSYEAPTPYAAPAPYGGGNSYGGQGSYGSGGYGGGGAVFGTVPGGGANLAAPGANLIAPGGANQLAPSNADAPQ
jgi:hypothetical protein